STRSSAHRSPQQPSRGRVNRWRIRLTRAVVAGAMLACGQLALPVHAASPEETLRATQAMLDASESALTAARRQVDEQYEQLQQLSPGDRDVRYAYVVATINQRRYREADPLLKELVALEPTNLDVLRTRVWLTTMLRDYGATLVQLEQLSAAMAEQEGLDTETAETTARFLGRVIAFLEGPANDASATAANPRLVANAKRDLLDRLTESQRTAFDEAFDAVTNRYLDLTESKEASQQRAVAAAREDRENRLDQVAEQRERIGDEREDLRDQQERLRSEMTDQLAELTKTDQPLATQQARLQTQMVAMQRDLAAIDLELSRLGRRIDTEEDPFLRDALRREAARLAAVARRYAVDLSGLDRQVAVVTAQRLELQRQRIELQRTIGGQLNQTAAELDKLAKNEKQADAIERRARRPLNATSNQARSLSAVASAFITYEPFPFQQERQRVLKSLGGDR
ncbi:MAG: hypothetical protein KDA62_01200, partial [Planctomycetales bacterium]|nr:hypothetical protein [Planctomycetales bacterium]